MDCTGRTNLRASSLPRYNSSGYFPLGLYKGPRVQYESSAGVDELRARINNVLASVKPRMLENAWRKIEYQLDILQSIKVSMLTFVKSL
jgi:hypothetical protein